MSTKQIVKTAARVCGAMVLPAIVAANVNAQDFYVSGSIGTSSADNPVNAGSFSSEFTTGEVTGVSPPLTLPAGTPVGWNTKLDDGTFFSIAGGLKTELFRYEIEYSAADYDVESHAGVTAGGILLDPIDVGVLLSGNVGDIGVSVGDFVAAGQGSIDTSTFFVNAYYDFMRDSAFSPYVGVGIGNMSVDVDYSPSATEIINDDDSVFVYQLILGVSYSINDAVEVYGNYRYRDGDDASVTASLIPATFDIEGNSSDTFEVGLRYSF